MWKKSSKLSFLVPATVNKSSRWNWDFLWYSVSANICRIYELNDLLNAYIFKSLLSLFCSHWDNILSSLSRLSHLKLYLSGVFLKLLILLMHYSSSHIYIRACFMQIIFLKRKIYNKTIYLCIYRKQWRRIWFISRNSIKFGYIPCTTSYSSKSKQWFLL